MATNNMASRDERVAALYARVISRVCERFEQHVAVTTKDAKDEREQQRTATARLVEVQWRERLTRYTGHAYSTLVVSAPSQAADASNAREEATSPATEGDDGAASDAAQHDNAAPSMAMGRPHALHALRAPPSIFATILSGKRKMEQLDGTTEDTSDDDHDKGTADTVDDQDIAPADVVAPTTTTTREAAPSLDVAPATALNVALVPLQCAARDVCFAYRKNAVRGRVKNVILTLLRRVRTDEEIAPKHLLLLTRSVETEQGDDFDDQQATTTTRRQRGQGTLVEVVEVIAGGAELVVQVAGSAQTHRVDIHETRRFYECVVSSGYVHLRFVHT